MDRIAQTYVKLVLALGQHDPLYVDAYYGPPEWRSTAELRRQPLEAILEDAKATRAALNSREPRDQDPILRLRWRFLGKQLEALIARVEMLRGKPRSFNEESVALYDVVDAGRSESYYEAIIAQLKSLLPKSSSLSGALDQLRSRFIIPKDKLDAVFRTAIDAARERTRWFIELPLDEDFQLEFVSGQVWGAYNWYKGNSHSLIQINTDHPISVDRVLGLACHEGYPGHHVYNALLEQQLVRARGWIEFSIYALYSPQSLIAEGTAEYGVELNFPAQERRSFERELLLPLAGLDPNGYEEYEQITALVDQLNYSSNDAARRYLDGKTTRQATIDWLERFSLSTAERAEQRLSFIEQHRSYVVTYNVGKQLVKEFVEAQGNTPADRWRVFEQLLSVPMTPSDLKDY